MVQRDRLMPQKMARAIHRIVRYERRRQEVHAVEPTKEFEPLLQNKFRQAERELDSLVGSALLAAVLHRLLVPTGVAATTFDTRSGTEFLGWDVSSNVSWYPTENLTFRLEVSHHEASIPYYSGHGGVTGPDGYKCGGLYSADGLITTCALPGWTPDLVQAETKLIFALLFRI